MVKEQDLIVRWTFDEGNGSVTNDVTGGGLDLLLSANAKWGLESNQTAMSKSSLNLQAGDAYAWSQAHDKIKAVGIFSYLLWFKTNGQPDAYTQLLSKKEDSYSSYFIQIEPDGRSLKTILRSYGSYHDNGIIPFSLNQWHQLVFTFDGTAFNTFIDGEWVANSNLLTPVDSNDGKLGVGGTQDGCNLFSGWIDDVRFYKTALHPSVVKESYGQGAGDFGATPTFTSGRSTSSMPVSVGLSFKDSSQNSLQVSGLSISDFKVTGGTISNLQSVGLNYTFDLNATAKPQRVLIELPAGVCRDDQNISNSHGSTVIVYSDFVTKSEDLVGWWTFDDLNGTQLQDYSGSGSVGTVLGNPTLDSSSPPALGTKSLILYGSGDAVKDLG